MASRWRNTEVIRKKEKAPVPQGWVLLVFCRGYARGGPQAKSPGGRFQRAEPAGSGAAGAVCGPNWNLAETQCREMQPIQESPLQSGKNMLYWLHKPAYLPGTGNKPEKKENIMAETTKEKQSPAGQEISPQKSDCRSSRSRDVRGHRWGVTGSDRPGQYCPGGCAGYGRRSAAGAAGKRPAGPTGEPYRRGSEPNCLCD